MWRVYSCLFFFKIHSSFIDSLHGGSKMKYFNCNYIFKVPEIPKKPVPEEKVLVPVPKKVEEPPTAKGTPVSDSNN